MDDTQIKYLGMVSNVIDRMARNSLVLKLCSLAIFVALFPNPTLGIHGLIGLLPVSAFWGLDAYYLRQERIFRGLYNDIVKGEGNVDFSMDPRDNSSKVPPTYKLALSESVAWFHGVTITPLVIQALAHIFF